MGWCRWRQWYQRGLVSERSELFHQRHVSKRRTIQRITQREEQLQRSTYSIERLQVVLTFYTDSDCKSCVHFDTTLTRLGRIEKDARPCELVPRKSLRNTGTGGSTVIRLMTTSRFTQGVSTQRSNGRNRISGFIKERIDRLGEEKREENAACCLKMKGTSNNLNGWETAKKKTHYIANLLYHR